MFSSNPSTNAPIRYQSSVNYATTYPGPVYADRTAQDATRNQSMAQAAYAGAPRQFNMPRGPGVQAGSNMQAYRAGISGQSQAAQGYAQAQQDLFNRLANEATARLKFQESLAGERGWMRDLQLDENDIQNRERLGGYKRFGDIKRAEQERSTLEANAAEHRKTVITQALLGS